MGAATLPTLSGSGHAQSYPAHPVRVIVGFAAGQAIDVQARLVSQWLSNHLGQQFLVENVPGGGGNIAAERVVRAQPDGYTLIVVGSNNYINASLYEKLNFTFINDIAPVASIGRLPNVMEVNPSVPVKTVPEFIAYAKANPGRLNFGSGGVGTTHHMAGELFKMMTGIDMIHVPYRGTPLAMSDLIGGRIQVMFDNLPTSLEHIRAGRLRALAVTTKERTKSLPEIPTVNDFVRGYEVSAVTGIGTPRDTPNEIIDALNQQINAGLKDAAINGHLAKLGIEALPNSPEAFRKLIAAETEKWARVVKYAGVKA
jgi:tripartite-type tricarboxylate transporter receptor subunit TctC